MILKAAIISLALSCTTMLSTARQQANAPFTMAPGAAQNRNTGGQNDQSQNDQAQNNQTQALRDDLTRMRALVQQMETNLAFVDTTQSPLKHQFQLEIDMWRTMINQMERRLQPQSRVNQVK